MNKRLLVVALFLTACVNKGSVQNYNDLPEIAQAKRFVVNHTKYLLEEVEINCTPCGFICVQSRCEVQSLYSNNKFVLYCPGKMAPYAECFNLY